LIKLSADNVSTFFFFKANKACNNELYFEKINRLTKQKTNTDDFIRRGKIGGFKDEMPQEFINKFDKWMEKEKDLVTGFD
jgi:Sulfotransferase domain